MPRCKLSCFRGPRFKLTEAMGSVGLVLLLPSRKEPLLTSNCWVGLALLLPSRKEPLLASNFVDWVDGRLVLDGRAQWKTGAR